MVEVVTFGCRLNTVESQAIKALAAGLGDAVIVNTCAVTTAAEREARATVARLHRERPGVPIIVTGCAAQIDPNRWAALPGVTRVLGNQEKLQARHWTPQAASAVAPISEARHHRPALLTGLDGRARAFLDVQQGCGHACTFCIIPQGRGPNRSVPIAVVVAHIRALVEAGHAEVVLTGVDLASWGQDLGSTGLATLLRAVLRAVPDLPRLRLSSLDPAALDDAFWTVFAEEDRLMPHLHLSVQAGSDMILKRMRRRHTRTQVLEVAAKARHLRPGAGLAADLIAGFPTETDAHFAETLALIGEAALPYLHVFPYSARPGTPAARMPQVPLPLRRQRAAQLRAAALPHAAAAHAAMLGTQQSIVVERGNRGHTESFAPVHLTQCTPGPSPEPSSPMAQRAPGTLIRCLVTAADAAGLEVAPWH